MNDPLWFPWQKVGNQNWSYFSSTFFTDNINFLLEFSHFLQTLFYNPTNVTGIHRVLSSVLLSSNRKKYKRELLHLTVKYLKKTRISSFPASNFMIIHSIQGCAIQHFTFTLKSITLISRAALKYFQHFQKKDKYSPMNKGNVS